MVMVWLRANIHGRSRGRNIGQELKKREKHRNTENNQDLFLWLPDSRAVEQASVFSEKPQFMSCIAVLMDSAILFYLDNPHGILRTFRIF